MDFSGILNKLVRESKNAIKKAAEKKVSDMARKAETFSFAALPVSAEELKALPEAALVR